MFEIQLTRFNSGLTICLAGQQFDEKKNSINPGNKLRPIYIKQIISSSWDFL